ncbi:hypothetical protein ACFYT4_08985 [Streptomyces sp. NPDC004609]|uniref:hypothetical protein n=1 Tax=Streptomyces sp. NPDC004609 TaxID=3364704 RepID=UPI0036850FD9
MTQSPHHERTTIRRALAALAGAVMLLLAFGAPQVSAAPQGFTAQAVAAGLTTSEATALQAEVDRYLAKTGGTQIAPNVIDLGRGNGVQVAVPGERQPRDLTHGRGAFIPGCVGGADPDYFCAYENSSYTGSHVYLHGCPGGVAIPFGSGGSWDNYLNNSVKVRMYDNFSTLIYTTPNSHSRDATADWTPIYRVQGCF